MKQLEANSDLGDFGCCPHPAAPHQDQTMQDRTPARPHLADSGVEPATCPACSPTNQKQHLRSSPSITNSLSGAKGRPTSNYKKAVVLASSAATVSSKQGGQKDRVEPKIEPTRKRYVILFMFFILQIVKSFQWICLASITNVVAKFYQVDNMAINWTTILFMVTFLVLALPVSWIMDLIGLRRSVLIGAVGVSLGIFIKCFSCHRGGFATGMWGHLIVGVCEPFFFSSYSQVASVWFPDNQVALATAVSLIGEQTGLALGFIIPPLVIGNDSNDFATIQRGLYNLFATVALISILNTVAILLFFDEEPNHAPGIARYKQKQDETVRRQSLQVELEKSARRRRSSVVSGQLGQSVSEQLKMLTKILRNRHFLLLLVGFGICQGVCYSIHTLLNQMIARPESLVDAASGPILGSGGTDTATIGQANTTAENPASEMLHHGWAEDEASLVVGNAGLIMILSGLLGSAVCGFFLDRRHNHKQASQFIYLLNLVAMLSLTGCLLLDSPTALYLVTIPVGFVQLGYATCAFDFSVELTYPMPELLSSTLLNMSAQIFGIPISLVGSTIVDSLGSLALGGFFSALLLVGLVIACLQGGELKRQNAVEDQIANAETLPDQEPRA